MTPPEIPDLLLGMQQMGQRLEESRRRLLEMRLEASAGGGMVKAVADGSGRLLQVTFDPELLARPDAEMLGDLVVAAVNQLQEKVREATAEQMREITGGLDLSLLGGLLP